MPINPKTYIEIPADKLRDAVKAAYDMSNPVGLGFLQLHEKQMSDEDADAILERGRGFIAASMDYVNGRQCKFGIYSDEGSPPRYFVRPYWYDHSEYQLVELLTTIGVEDAQAKIDAANAEQEAENERYRQSQAATA